MKLGLEDRISDATTLWLSREKLAKSGLVEKLFERVAQQLDAKDYVARGGQKVDATIVRVPKQHNTRDENDSVRACGTPEPWKEKPAKNRQGDKDARVGHKRAVPAAYSDKTDDSRSSV